MEGGWVPGGPAHRYNPIRAVAPGTYHTTGCELEEPIAALAKRLRKRLMVMMIRLRYRYLQTTSRGERGEGGVGHPGPSWTLGLRPRVSGKLNLMHIPVNLSLPPTPRVSCTLKSRVRIFHLIKQLPAFPVPSILGELVGHTGTTRYVSIYSPRMRWPSDKCHGHPDDKVWLPCTMMPARTWRTGHARRQHEPTLGRETKT